jgi:hypothetical protein
MLLMLLPLECSLPPCWSDATPMDPAPTASACHPPPSASIRINYSVRPHYFLAASKSQQSHRANPQQKLSEQELKVAAQAGAEQVIRW